MRIPRIAARPTTVLVTIITDFGRPTEQRKMTTARLFGKNATVDLATITLGTTKTTKRR